MLSVYCPTGCECEASTCMYWVENMEASTLGMKMLSLGHIWNHFGQGTAYCSGVQDL